MKRFINIVKWCLFLFVLIPLGCATAPPMPLSKTTSWKTHHSPFGFSIDLPSHFLILTREKLKENPDLIETWIETTKPEFTKADRVISESDKLLVRDGKAEFYIDSTYRGGEIKVEMTFGRIPKAINELMKEHIDIELISEEFEIKSKKSDFKLMKLGGLNATYCVSDEKARFQNFSTRGKRIYYTVQLPQNVKISANWYCSRNDFKTIKKNFDEIMKSIRLLEK